MPTEYRRQHCIKLTEEHWDKLCRIAEKSGMAAYEVVELMIDRITNINKSVTVEMKEGK